MTRLSGRRTAAAIAIGAMIAGGCSSPPRESPWADRGAPGLPTPTSADDTGSNEDATGDAQDTDRREPPEAVRLTDRTCAFEEIRCGVASVAQVEGSPDLVELEYRVLADSGSRTPVVQLLDGSASSLLGPEELPDRPLVVIGSRGLWPGGPTLSCPEFYATETADQTPDALDACMERLRLAGVDPAGTVPSQAGHDVGAVIVALGFDEVDLVVPSWRALATPPVTDHVAVRRVVYTDPWFATDRAVGPARAALVTLEAVWSRCAELPSCATAGTVADLFSAVAELDANPLDDVHDTFSDEPEPLDGRRVARAIVSSAGRAADAAFLPQLHRAILDRDADTVSSFVQAMTSSSTEVNLLGVMCSLFDGDAATTAGLPLPLRADADEAVDVFGRVCSVWPAEDRSAVTPLPGLTVITRSTPVDGADHASALLVGPVITEPTVGQPTASCVAAAALAWFDAGEVTAEGCRAPLTIGDRSQAISLTRATYEADDVTIELSVPDAWTDSGYGTWWRDADPIDNTNLDVYVWDVDDAETARGEILEDWGVVDAELTSTQVDDRVWLLATGSTGVDSVYQFASGRVGDTTVVVVLQSAPGESSDLADEVLRPALEGLIVR